MKTSNKNIEREDLTESSNERLDPFAVDFFGASDSNGIDDKSACNVNQKNLVTQKLKLKDIKALNWHKDLPKVSVKEAEFSNQLLELPKKLNDTAIECVKETFSPFTLFDKKKIDVEVISISEVNLNDILDSFNKTPNLFLTLKCNPNSESGFIVANALFASSIIDLVLGGKGNPSNNFQQLSAIENTVIEFLIINLFSNLNSKFQNKKYSLRHISSSINPGFNKVERGAEIVLEITLGKVSGIVSLLLPKGFMDDIENDDDSITLQNKPFERLRVFNKFKNNFSINLHLGETTINANEMAFLEKNDVILLEKREQIWEAQVKVFVGDSKNFCLKGKLKPSESDEILPEELIFEIQEIDSQKDQLFLATREKMKTETEKKDQKNLDENTEKEVSGKPKEKEMEEGEAFETNVEVNVPDEAVQDELIEANAVASLENVMVNLRVNLGGRRLSLKELQNLRTGQIIELGCRPNDPVELVTDNDNRPLATGELLDVEGQLGVRLTKILF